MRIKNWSKFQHFKDRKPPWVKLYRDLLDDIEWHELDSKAAKVLTMLWLIASENDGEIPSTKILSFRLRMSEKDTKDCINKLSHWIEDDCIDLISNVYQDDRLETERETEKETETKKATSVACPPDVSKQVWDDWQQLRKTKKASVTNTVVNGARKEAEKLGWSLEQFLVEWCTRGSQGLKAEWISKDNPMSKTGQTNQSVMSGLTRGLVGGGNVRLLGN